MKTRRRLLHLTGFIAVLVLGGYWYWNSPEATGPAPVPVESEAYLNETSDAYTINVSLPIQNGETPREIQAAASTTIQEFKQQIAAMADVSTAARYQLSMSSDTYRGPQTISHVLSGYQYTGGAHGLPFTTTYTYDQEGNRVTLNDLAKVPLSELLAYLEPEAKNQVQSALGDTFALFTDGFSPDPNNWKVWYIEESELVFIFGVYQVAPYAAGPQTVRFGAETLGEYIDNSYLTQSTGE